MKQITLTVSDEQFSSILQILTKKQSGTQLSLMDEIEPQNSTGTKPKRKVKKEHFKQNTLKAIASMREMYKTIEYFSITAIVFDSILEQAGVQDKNSFIRKLVSKGIIEQGKRPNRYKFTN